MRKITQAYPGVLSLRVMKNTNVVLSWIGVVAVGLFGFALGCFASASRMMTHHKILCWLLPSLDRILEVCPIFPDAVKRRHWSLEASQEYRVPVDVYCAPLNVLRR